MTLSQTPVCIYIYIYMFFHLYAVCWSNVTKINTIIKTKENTYKYIIHLYIIYLKLVLVVVNYSKLNTSLLNKSIHFYK